MTKTTTTKEGMTAAQRRKAVAIAEDVLKQLRRRRNRPTLSAYAYLTGEILDHLAPEDDLRDHVDAVQAQCEVCLLGACLLSKARLFDGVPLAGLVSHNTHGAYAARHQVTSALSDVFDARTMDMIETAFEGTEMTEDADGTDADDLAAAIRFADRHSDPDFDKENAMRVRAVMENIIAHEGRFVP